MALSTRAVCWRGRTLRASARRGSRLLPVRPGMIEVGARGWKVALGVTNEFRGFDVQSGRDLEDAAQAWISGSVLDRNDHDQADP